MIKDHKINKINKNQIMAILLIKNNLFEKWYICLSYLFDNNVKIWQRSIKLV